MCGRRPFRAGPPVPIGGTPPPLRDGRSGGLARLRVGIARPSSRPLLGRPVPFRALRRPAAGLATGSPPVRGSPVPGYLAGARPITGAYGRSTSGRQGPRCIWRQRHPLGGCRTMSTRLALQLFLVKGFKLYSFQLQDPKEPCISIYCHYLPVSGLGNLRACCLPWM